MVTDVTGYSEPPCRLRFQGGRPITPRKQNNKSVFSLPERGAAWRCPTFFSGHVSDGPDRMYTMNRHEVTSQLFRSAGYRWLAGAITAEALDLFLCAELVLLTAVLFKIRRGEQSVAL